jgi:hypothetical protein
MSLSDIAVCAKILTNHYQERINIQKEMNHHAAVLGNFSKMKEEHEGAKEILDVSVKIHTAEIAGHMRLLLNKGIESAIRVVLASHTPAFRKAATDAIAMLPRGASVTPSALPNIGAVASAPHAAAAAAPAAASASAAAASFTPAFTTSNQGSTTTTTATSSSAANAAPSNAAGNSSTDVSRS